jgi:outer membrane protein assembly factor BamA
MKKINCIFFIIFLFFTQQINAQPKYNSLIFDSTYFESLQTDTIRLLNVRSIKISGNKKTKGYIILREMKLKAGQQVKAAHLLEKLNASQALIYNTNLFSTVTVTPVMIGIDDVDIYIEVLERWYIYPTPYLKLTDRNFNDWWTTHNHDLKRTTYGLKYADFNVSGRGDQLNIYLLTGYARNISISYTAPYSNKKLTEGFSVGLSFVQTKELDYKTTSKNKSLLFKSNRFDRTAFTAVAAYTVRKGFYKKHTYKIQYSFIDVNDSIVSPSFNASYFNSNKSNVGFTDLYYGYQFLKVDNINYPLKGKVVNISLVKRGLGLTGGINMFQVDLTWRKYMTHPHQFYSSVQFYSKLKLPFKQPYFNQRAMGFGDYYVNGLENYVIDGVASSIAKFNLSKKLFAFKIKVPFKIKQFPYLPFSFYAKTYVNTGFSYNKPNGSGMLNDRFLYSTGVGLDLLTLYDFRISTEFSMNQLNEKGLFLHLRSIL